MSLLLFNSSQPSSKALSKKTTTLRFCCSLYKLKQTTLHVMLLLSDGSAFSVAPVASNQMITDAIGIGDICVFIASRPGYLHNYLAM
jgi:hypothetical protein